MLLFSNLSDQCELIHQIMVEVEDTMGLRKEKLL